MRRKRTVEYYIEDNVLHARLDDGTMVVADCKGFSADDINDLIDKLIADPTES